MNLNLSLLSYSICNRDNYNIGIIDLTVKINKQLSTSLFSNLNT